MDKIVCVGKNYVEHARELQRLIGDLVPDKPVLFLKPPSAIAQAVSGQDLELPLPEGRGAVHPECEIVLKLRQGGFELSPEQAARDIESVTLGLDMTLRDEQSRLKKAGAPWETSKVFRASAALGPWLSVTEFPGFLDEEFAFEVNGKPRQKGVGSQMSLSPVECVAYASRYFELRPGDVLFTGTPAGVGPVLPGDEAVLSWGGRLRYRVLFRGVSSKMRSFQ